MDQEEFQKLNEELVEILRNLLKTGDWEASLFLRTAHKKLQGLYDQAVQLERQFEAKTVKSQEEEHKLKLKQGYSLIYVSLYQTDAYNLIKWENTLKNISEYSINRPIYRFEENIQAIIRSKQDSPNEAYVSIYIKSTDVIPPYAGKLIEDKLGHELLTVRENSLQPKSISEFVHQGKRYLFKNGKLLLKSDIK